MSQEADRKRPFFARPVTRGAIGLLIVVLSFSAGVLSSSWVKRTYWGIVLDEACSKARRWKAAIALTECRGGEDKLLARVDSPHPGVRDLSIWGLCQIGEPWENLNLLLDMPRDRTMELLEVLESFDYADQHAHLLKILRGLVRLDYPPPVIERMESILEKFRVGGQADEKPDPITNRHTAQP